MTTIEIIILAIALSIDASIASFSQGTILKNNKRKYSTLLAFSMGFFQALMPLIGWYSGSFVNQYFQGYGYWIASGVFLVLGLKFIKDATDSNTDEKLISCISITCILSLSIATSIDALAAGASLALLNVSIIFPVIIIGIITFFGSLAGFWAGYLLKKLNKKFFEIFGGILLILLSIKLIVEAISCGYQY